MSAKSNKTELSEELMAIWKDEQTLWDAMPLFRLIFSNKVPFQMQNLFSPYPGDS